MPIIHVAKRFMLKDDNNRLTEYEVGRYEVTQEIADHWYVQAHLEGFVEPPPRVGTEQAQQAFAEQAARMAEPTDAQTQKPAPSPATQQAKPERRFAGRDVPKPVDTGLSSFIDPRTV
jgi:hypothetical protein